MVFQSTLVFIRFLSYMVHPTKSLASMGLAQARPNYQEVVIIQWYCSYHPVLSIDVWLYWNRMSIIIHFRYILIFQIFLDNDVAVDERNDDKQTPLHLACIGGHHE